MQFVSKLLDVDSSLSPHRTIFFIRNVPMPPNFLMIRSILLLLSNLSVLPICSNYLILKSGPMNYSIDWSKISHIPFARYAPPPFPLPFPSYYSPVISTSRYVLNSCLAETWANYLILMIPHLATPTARVIQKATRYNIRCYRLYQGAYR